MPVGGQAQVSVVRSRSPEQDTALLIDIFPAFQLERWNSTDSAVLVWDGVISLIVVGVDFDAPKLDPTILVLASSLVEEALRRCRAKSSVSMHARSSQETIELTLPGGACIVVLSSAIVSSPSGRERLTLALASKEGIMESFGEDSTTLGADSSLSEEFEDEPLDDVDANGKAIMEAEERFESDAGPRKVPSVALSVLSKNDTMMSNIPTNSSVPIPVETDLFVGHFLLILRPIDPTTDPYWNERIFSTKKRRFVCQLQGKFKYVPENPVFAGFEVTDPMSLGLIAKGLCGALLKFLKSFNSHLHYAFGSDKERAHIVFPAWSSFERFVVTKPGDTPPKMGEDFVESKESVSARKAMRSKPEWNTQDTYSMSFYTMYFDLAQWKLVNLPFMNDIDLHTFWKNSDCRLSVYEKTGSDDKHLISKCRYFFVVQVRFLGLDAKDETEDETVLPWHKHRRSSLLQRSDRQESGTFLVEEYEEEEYFFFDAEEENSDHELGRDELNARSQQGSHPMKLLHKVDSLCPAWIEVSQKGKYTTAFAFPNTESSTMVLRTYQEFESFFSIDDAKDTTEEVWSPRLSSTEKRRRILGLSLAEAAADSSSKAAKRVKDFQSLRTELDSTFLKRKRRAIPSKFADSVRTAGFVARAISDRHWIEEWAIVTDQLVLFFSPEKSKPHYHINLRKVLKAQRLAVEERPQFPSYALAEVELLGQSIYLMFSSESLCEEWLESILSAIPDRDGGVSLDSAGSGANDLWMSVDDPTDEFMQKSSMWNCKQRRILNCGRFSFRTQPCDPCTVASDLLVKALKPREESDDSLLRDFLRAASALKNVDAYRMEGEERLAFFLNVYHALIMHAFLLLGPPDSGFKWMSYFNTISYQCSDDIFSLAELEHCIIRAEMDYPSQFISRFVLPKSTYRYGLSRPDYRICFVLNSGSSSNPDSVPVYTKSLLDQQLDEATRMYIQRSVQVRKSSRSGIVVTLPKVCQWFSDDIGDGSINAVLLMIQSCLDGERRALLASCYSESERRFNLNDVQVKYLSYNFECRNLRLMRTEGPYTIE
jgi:hypothetical protein